MECVEIEEIGFQHHAKVHERKRQKLHMTHTKIHPQYNTSDSIRQRRCTLSLHTKERWFVCDSELVQYCSTLVRLIVLSKVVVLQVFKHNPSEPSQQNHFHNRLSLPRHEL